MLTVITTREDSRENLPTKRNPLEPADLLYGKDSESELTGWILVKVLWATIAGHRSFWLAVEHLTAVDVTERVCRSVQGAEHLV